MSSIKKFRFLIQWFSHAFILWFLINLSSTLSYFYRVKTEGNFLIKADGTYVSQWEYFTIGNIYGDRITMTLFFSICSEACYRFIFHKRRLAIFMSVTALFSLCFSVFINTSRGKDSFYRLTDYLTAFTVFFLYSFLYALVQDFFEKRKNRAAVIAARTASELASLRAQLNPHFFFNTLNSIYGLSIEENAKRTSQAVESMGNMMRFIMNESPKEKTSIENEVAFMKDYLSLQKIRIGNSSNITVKTIVDYDGQGGVILPALCIPFIENAFQYGLSMDYPSFIDLTWTVANQSLVMQLQNSIHAGQDNSGHGTGIRNTQRRLELMYPDHVLEITTTDKSYSVSLHLNLHV